MINIPRPARLGGLKPLSHPFLSKPAISLGLTSLSLLLLVLVLLSVPGPIKGLYWFRLDNDLGDEISAGVLGWCMTKTSNCTYAPLSDNPYLSDMIDSGQALTVRIMLPTACYWLIVTLVTWVGLTILTPRGYKIKDLDSITRHLRFAVLEACVLCITLFGCVLCWLAFGLGRMAYLSVEAGGGKPRSGQAMETTAVAGVISLLSIFTASLGLHLRLKKASSHWKEEASMNKRRSMLSMADRPMASVEAKSMTGSEMTVGPDGGRRYSNAPEYTLGSVGHSDEEERLESKVDLARRNSRDDEAMIRRASMISVNDSPYGAAAHAQRTAP